MTKKKAEDATAEMPAAKRPRLVGTLKKQETVTFGDLNNDCLVHILSFLEPEEMNDAMLINSDFCKARNADSLDQSRKAIINCTSDEANLLHLMQTIESKKWASGEFSGESNKRILKIIGLKSHVWWDGLQMQRDGFNYVNRVEEWLAERTDFKLTSVTSLDVSSSYTGIVQPRIVQKIARILPNLQEGNFSHDGDSPPLCYSIRDFCSFCPSLCRLRFNRSIVNIFPPAVDSEHAKQITELYLNGSMLTYDEWHDEWRPMLSVHDTNEYIFHNFSNLQRLDIQNAFHQGFISDNPNKFCQEQLVKLVRSHPTLRWLKSDLTDENIALLKVERPEVILVN